MSLGIVIQTPACLWLATDSKATNIDGTSNTKLVSKLKVLDQGKTQFAVAIAGTSEINDKHLFDHVSGYFAKHDSELQFGNFAQYIQEQMRLDVESYTGYSSLEEKQDDAESLLSEFLFATSPNCVNYLGVTMMSYSFMRQELPNPFAIGCRSLVQDSLDRWNKIDRQPPIFLSDVFKKAFEVESIGPPIDLVKWPVGHSPTVQRLSLKQLQSFES